MSEKRPDFKEMVTHCGRIVLESLLNGKLIEGVERACLETAMWAKENLREETKAGRRHTFTAQGLHPKGYAKGYVAVWDDGLSVDQRPGETPVAIADNLELCAFRMQEGKTYRVTIEEVSP